MDLSRYSVKCHRPADLRPENSYVADAERSRKKRPKSDRKEYRVRRHILFNPVICIAESCHHWRYHVMDSGVYPIGSTANMLAPVDRHIFCPGGATNPTNITACGFRSRKFVEVELEQSLDHKDWCDECRKVVESIIQSRKIAAEPKPQRKGWR